MSYHVEEQLSMMESDAILRQVASDTEDPFRFLDDSFVLSLAGCREALLHPPE